MKSFLQWMWPLTWGVLLTVATVIAGIVVEFGLSRSWTRSHPTEDTTLIQTTHSSGIVLQHLVLTRVIEVLDTRLASKLQEEHLSGTLRRIFASQDPLPFPEGAGMLSDTERSLHHSRWMLVREVQRLAHPHVPEKRQSGQYPWWYRSMTGFNETDGGVWALQVTDGLGWPMRAVDGTLLFAPLASAPPHYAANTVGTRMMLDQSVWSGTLDRTVPDPWEGGMIPYRPVLFGAAVDVAFWTLVALALQRCLRLIRQGIYRNAVRQPVCVDIPSPGGDA